MILGFYNCFTYVFSTLSEFSSVEFTKFAEIGGMIGWAPHARRIAAFKGFGAPSKSTLPSKHIKTINKPPSGEIGEIRATKRDVSNGSDFGTDMIMILI